MDFTYKNYLPNIGCAPKASTDNTSKSHGCFGERTAFAVNIKRLSSIDPARSTPQSPPPTELSDGFRTIKHAPVAEYTENPPASPENTKKDKISSNWIEMKAFN